MAEIELFHLNWPKASSIDNGVLMHAIIPAADPEKFKERIRKAMAVDGLYEKVATFSGGTLDGVFAATQTIDEESWAELPIDGMTLAAQGGQRSTSVGDIVKTGEGTYAVAGLGFVRID